MGKLKVTLWVVGILVVLFLLYGIFSGSDEGSKSNFEDLQKEAEKSVEEKMEKGKEPLTKEDNIETKLSEHQAKECVEKDGNWCTSVSYGTGWSEDCMNSKDSCQAHRASVLQDKSICDTVTVDWKKDNCIENVETAMKLHREG